MKSRPSTALLLCVFFFFNCAERRNPEVVAEVNGDWITRAELKRYIQTQDPDLAEPPSEEESQMLRLTILREVIDRHIMLQRAARLGLMAVDAEVQNRLDEYRAPYDTAEEFQAHLGERGLTESELRTELQRTLTIEKLFNKEIASRVSVTDAEMRRYYQQNRSNFHFPEQQFRLAQILVTAEPEIPVPNHRNDDARNLEEARAKIETIEQRLQEGEPFEVLAENFSEDPVSTASGGDLGFYPQSFLEKVDISLRRVVASLSPGEISPIIRSDNEFRIIKLISREPAGQREFSDPRIQQTIRETLLNRKDKLLRTAYMEAIRNEADVTNYLALRIVESFGISD